MLFHIDSNDCKQKNYHVSCLSYQPYHRFLNALNDFNGMCFPGHVYIVNPIGRYVPEGGNILLHPHMTSEHAGPWSTRPAAVYGVFPEGEILPVGP